MNIESKNGFENLKRYYFDHSTTLRFIDFLKTKTKLIAAHKKGEKSFIYREVENSSEVVLDYPRTIQPLKKYFLPPEEALLKFDLNSNQFKTVAITTEKQIFLGIHAYEMQAVKRLDYSFAQGNNESNYFKRRENALFIGISFTPDNWHFSKSVGIAIEELDGFCIYFEPVENGYLVFEIDEEGKKLLAEFGGGVKVDTPINLEFVDKSFKAKITYHYNRLPQIFSHVYNSKVWDEVAKKCLNCGTCNLLCPTCYCFDVRDEVNLNVVDGERRRFWDGCMLNPFAQVAGGENFREKTSARTRHRLYRKFKYITELSGKLHCVGCGRCSRYCPAEINIVQILNDLIDDYSQQQKAQTL